jgi:hypothetical protein
MELAMKKQTNKNTVASTFQALNSGRISSAQYARSIKQETRRLVRETPMPKRRVDSSK